MLRTITHIILSLVLLVSTAGVTIDRHYCGTRLVSVSLTGDTQSCCEPGDGCCHNDIDTYKLEVDYTVSPFSIDFDQLAVEIPVQQFFNISLPDGSLTDTEFSFFVPPRKLRTSLSTLQTYRL